MNYTEKAEIICSRLRENPDKAYCVPVSCKKYLEKCIPIIENEFPNIVIFNTSWGIFFLTNRQQLKALEKFIKTQSVRCGGIYADICKEYRKHIAYCKFNDERWKKL